MKNDGNKNLSSENTYRPFHRFLNKVGFGQKEKVRGLLFLLVILLELNGIMLAGSMVLIRKNSELVFNSILENEEDDLKSSVDNAIKDLDRRREVLKAAGMTEEEVHAQVQKEFYEKIYSDRFSAGQYMWVNQILNYAGGDRYAIRLIHPGFPETEGEYLSTETKDARGNTPYKEELEIAKTYGSGFQRYFFPDNSTGKSIEKITYLRLYPDYDWVICKGEELDTITSYENQQRSELVPVLFRIVLIGSIIMAVTTILTMAHYFSQYREELTNKNRELEQIAYQDSFTGIANRGGLILHLDQWIADPETKQMTGVFLDLDDFKLINDLYGHFAGDAALCRIAAYLRASFPNALIGRTGGDEFCVILRNQSPGLSAKQIMSALKQKIEFTADGEIHTFTVSAGYAHYPSQASNREDLMRVMDNALYEAKLHGKNTTIGYHPEISTARRDRLGFNVEKMASGMPGAFLIYQADETEKILFGNNHLIRLYECSSYEDFLQYTGGSFRRMIHPDDVERVEKDILDQIRNDRKRNPQKDTGFEDYISYRIITKTGKIKHVLDMGRLVPDEHFGEIYYVVLQDMEDLGCLIEKNCQEAEQLHSAEK